MAAPITPHAMPARACERQDSGAPSPDALGNRFSADIRQFSNQHSDVRDMRRLNFPSMSWARNAGASFSTTNQPTRPTSSFAQPTFTSALDAVPIQQFRPFYIEQSQ